MYENDYLYLLLHGVIIGWIMDHMSQGIEKKKKKVQIVLPKAY